MPRSARWPNARRTRPPKGIYLPQSVCGRLLTARRGAALGSLGGQEAVGSEAEGSRGSSRTPRDSWLAWTALAAGARSAVVGRGRGRPTAPPRRDRSVPGPPATTTTSTIVNHKFAPLCAHWIRDPSCGGSSPCMVRTLSRFWRPLTACLLAPKSVPHCRRDAACNHQRCANCAFRSGNLCSKKQSNYAQIMLQILLFYASVMLWKQPNYVS